MSNVYDFFCNNFRLSCVTNAVHMAQASLNGLLERPPSSKSTFFPPPRPNSKKGTGSPVGYTNLVGKRGGGILGIIYIYIYPTFDLFISAVYNM